MDIESTEYYSSFCHSIKTSNTDELFHKSNHIFFLVTFFSFLKLFTIEKPIS